MNLVLFNKKRKSLIYLVLVIILIITLIIPFFLRKSITIKIDNTNKKIITYKNTVKDILKDENIYVNSKDKIFPSLNSKIHNNDKITIKRAINIKLSVDNKELSIMSSEDTVNSLLKSQKIILKPTDIVTPDLNTKLCKDMNINITRVEIKKITQVLPLNYETIVKNDDTLANTKRKIIQNGVQGEKKVIANITYNNGKKVSKKILSEVITKKPKNKIIVQGTFPVMPVSRSGNHLSYSKLFTAKTTAYYAIYGVGKTYTASGRKAIRNPNGYSTVAVDPNVIPLGTKIFIQNYGFAIAADTGTSIKGNKIDVFFNTKQEACNWGVKYVKVYIIK